METKRGAHYSADSEESYYESRGMKLENESEYIKYVIMLLRAMCLLRLLQLVCCRQMQRKLTLHLAL